LSKDEPWDARGSTGSPRAWEPISARSKLDHYVALAILATLALGIGASTAIFSMEKQKKLPKRATTSAQ